MSRNFAKAIALAAAVTLPLSISAQAEDRKLDRGERELAELLEGYEAGEPVNCLRTSQSDRLSVIDNTALVFRDGRTLYVNRTSAPRHIDDFDIPVFRLFGARLCRMDRIEWIGRQSGIGGPVSFLREFIPYTEVKNDS